MDNFTFCQNQNETLAIVHQNWIGLGCLGIIHLIIGASGIWANQAVLKELQLVKMSKLVNNLTYNLAWCCSLFSAIQMATGLRFLYQLYCSEENPLVADILILSWYFFTILIHILVAYTGITRYLFVFKVSYGIINKNVLCRSGGQGGRRPPCQKMRIITLKVLLFQKSMARSMRDTPAYSILAGNFILWSCVFGTFIVEDTLLGISDKKIIRYFLSYEGLFSESRLYIYWWGQVVETQEKHLLVIIHIIINHLVVIVFDVLAFHLYQKIQDRQTENPKPNDKEDFHNIMDLTENCSQSVNRCDQVEDNRHRHHNFVPWHIHRQVLLCTTVASAILILAFIFISKFF